VLLLWFAFGSSYIEEHYEPDLEPARTRLLIRVRDPDLKDAERIIR
jgi:hypothetical protein